MDRVAIFLNRCLPVSEIFVAQQAAALRRYTPHIVACSQSQPSVAGNFPVSILNAHGSVREKIAEQIFKAIRSNREMQADFAGSRLVHAHFGPSGWLASRMARRARRPLVVTLHGFDVLKDHISLRRDGLLQTVYARNRGKLGRDAARFICVSRYIRERAIAFGFPAEKCVVQPLGIPVRHIPVQRPEKATTDPVRLLAVGRLVPFKGHGKLLEAVAELQRNGRNVTLDIVGDGPLRETLAAQARALHGCTFHGAQAHDRVLELMRGSDIFCHTSYRQPNGQTEAFGLVLLEAQMAGLPVVAFASGGVPDAFADGVTGLSVPEGDAPAFAASLARLIGDAALRRRLADAAPRFVTENYDNDKLTAGLENIYDEVVREAEMTR